MITLPSKIDLDLSEKHWSRVPTSLKSNPPQPSHQWNLFVSSLLYKATSDNTAEKEDHKNDPVHNKSYFISKSHSLMRSSFNWVYSFHI